MSAQHTPGPWRIERQRAPNGGTYYRIYDADDANAVIAQVIGDGRIEYHENASLIAAAPDLLAALQECITDDGATCWNSRAYAERRIRYISDLAHAAIAKATGGDHV